METWELVARELIRDTLGRYPHCADTGRFAELAALFTEDGVLEIEGRPLLRGRAAILDLVQGAKASLVANTSRPYIRHHVSSIQIEIDGPDEATARSYFLAITERGPDHWGRYSDRLTKVDERWLFRHRRVRVDGRAADSWAATRPVGDTP